MNIQLDDIRDDIRRMVTIALEEDIGSGDITAQLIPEDKVSTATVITREDCVLCGQAWFDEVFHQLGNIDSVHWHYKDGQGVTAGSVLVTLSGNARSLLTGERTALNFLQTLCATATITRKYVARATGTHTRLLDTRKTIPGLRTAQKYAVSCGGGNNHRIGLYDAFLIKENHIAACGGIELAVETARSLDPTTPIEVEVETLEEFTAALDAGANRIMLDEMSLDDIRQAVETNHGRAEIEVSGSLTQTTITELCKLNVDYLSFGALTKHVRAVDLSMRIVENSPQGIV